MQARLPILIGGGGEKKTLRIVARYADACNVGGGFDNVKRKDEILRQHCAEVGRDESEIERTVGMGICVIRDDAAEAQRVANAIFARNGNAKPWENQLVGTPEQVAGGDAAVPGHRVPALHHRLPVAARRRDDGAAHRRGEADGRGDLTTRAMTSYRVKMLDLAAEFDNGPAART